MPRAAPVTIARRPFRSMAFMRSRPVQFPGCGAARGGAPLFRDRIKLRVRDGPGSAAHHSALLHAALRPGNAALLELHAVAALEPEHRPRLAGRGDLEAEILDDAADLGHLLGVALGELARTDIKRVLEPDPHIAADHGGGSAEIHLMAAAGQHRPQIVLAEQLVRGALHEEEIVEIGADAAENAEDELQEHRWLKHAAVDQMREIVEVAGVVTLVLEFHAM